MLIVSALVVRNFYAAYINPNASERTYVLLGRVIGALTIVGGVYVSLVYMDVFEQLKLAWEMPILFASLFWIGMYWRRATKWAAWVTVLFTLSAFFVIPIALPAIDPDLVNNQQYAVTNEIVTTIVTRKAAPTDVARREAEITLWEQKVRRWLEEDETRTREGAIEKFGHRPEPRALGETVTTTYKTGGKSIYWTGPVVPVDNSGNELRFDDTGRVTGVLVKDDDGNSKVMPPAEDTPQDVLEEVSRVQEDQDTRVVRRRFRDDVKLRGSGRFEIDYLVYRHLGINLTNQSDPMIETLRLPTRVVLPFVVLIVFSLITPRVKKDVLDRFFVKMKTPVEPDPEADARELELSYENPSRYDSKRLFRVGGLEMQRPTVFDVAGFVIAFVICFLLIWVTVWIAQLGS
jgi:SSS family solute:Na+ symporter